MSDTIQNVSKNRLLTFNPASGGAASHIQTVLPRWVRRTPLFSPHWETLTTPDDDILSLAWSEDPEQPSAQTKPLFILFHGLEGSFHSPYANGLMYAFAQQGWLSVMMHFRGCNGQPNRLPRAYHSGETSDPRYFLEQVHHRFPSNYKMVTGVSLGGNMLANYLAEFAEQPLVDSATIISAPFDLRDSSNRINQGASRIYQAYLLHSLKQNVYRKLGTLRQAIPITQPLIRQLKTLQEFDDLITAPLHGFCDAQDYYQRCSAISKLGQIRLPTLILHAQDDPFMTDAVIPNQPLPETINYQLLKHGGHVGFLSGTLLKPRFWLEEMLPLYYREQPRVS